MEIKLSARSIRVPPLLLPGEEDYESAKVLAYSYTDEDYDDCDNPLRIHIKSDKTTQVPLTIKPPSWAVVILQRGTRFEYLTPESPVEITVTPPRTSLNLYVLSKIQRASTGVLELQIGGTTLEVALSVCK